MILGGGSMRLTEEQMLARKRSIDAERTAQAILRRRVSAQQGMAKVLAAKPKPKAETVFEGTS